MIIYSENVNSSFSFQGQARTFRLGRKPVGSLFMKSDGGGLFPSDLPGKVVLRKGLEPLRLTAHAPQTCVSTNSTT
jgi:hypothetical protein